MLLLGYSLQIYSLIQTIFFQDEVNDIGCNSLRARNIFCFLAHLILNFIKFIYKLLDFHFSNSK